MTLMVKLSELCHQIIELVDNMRQFAADEDWSAFWALDEKRNMLCQTLQNGQHSPAEFRACRSDLEILLEKNNALQADVLAIKQHYQNELSAHRQQRQAASVYARQGEMGR